MSTAPRGRHRVARHSAPKKKSALYRKQMGTAFGLAGLSSAVIASGSTVQGVVQAGDMSVVGYPQNDIIASQKTSSVIDQALLVNRMQAASRSEDRQTLAEAEILIQAAVANNPVADITAVIDVTPTMSSTERKSLQALASTTDQLDSLIAQAQDQKNQQAKLLVSEQQAIENAKLKAQAEADAVIAEAQARAEAALAEAQRIRQIGVVTVPIQGKYQLSARFGQRGGYWSGGWHTGLDFRVKSGTSVKAAANGEIISAGWGGAYGYRIEIDHGNGYVTTYNHLSKIEKTSGKVAAGGEIGYSGSSGNTTGPHLHFEVLKDGVFENPSKWLWGK